MQICGNWICLQAPFSFYTLPPAPLSSTPFLHRLDKCWLLWEEIIGFSCQLTSFVTFKYLLDHKRISADVKATSALPTYSENLLNCSAELFFAIRLFESALASLRSSKIHHLNEKHFSLKIWNRSNHLLEEEFLQIIETMLCIDVFCMLSGFTSDRGMSWTLWHSPRQNFSPFIQRKL